MTILPLSFVYLLAASGTVQPADNADPAPVDPAADASADADPAVPEPDPDFDDLGDDEPEPTDSAEPTAPAVSTEAAVAPIAPAETQSDTGISDFGGRFGLGVIRTIAGVNGINARYFVSDHFAIGANIGVALFTYKENDPATVDICPGPTCELENQRTVAALGASLEGIYFAHLGRTAGQLPFRADFGLGGRFGILQVVNTADIEDNLDDPLELHIEIPLIIQLMFGNNFALAPEFGVDFRIVPGNREDGDINPGLRPVPDGGVSGPGFGFDITPGIGLFAGASMHYYFGH